MSKKKTDEQQQVEDIALVAEQYANILDIVCPDRGEGTEETPLRAAHGLWELTEGYDLNPADLFKTFDAEGYDEMVVVGDIAFSSLCEHHLLPFHGKAHVAYIPDGQIVGLSKIARLVDLYARRLQVQERLTAQVADAMQEHLVPKGVMVVLEAEHLCMAIRGAKKSGTLTTTSAIRGVFKDQLATRQEALSLLGK